MKIIKRGFIPNKKTLSNLIEIGRNKKKLPDDMVVSFITMSDITNIINNKEDRLFKDVKKGYTYFENGDVLVAKITPCFENGKGCLADDLTNNIGLGSTEFFVLRDFNNLGVSKFVKYVTQQNTFRYTGSKKMVGSGGQRRVPKDFILNYPIIDININEYKLISHILSLQEEQIENIKQLIKKIETRNQYYAEKILSGELRVRKNEDGNMEFYNNTEWDEIKINTFIDKQERKIPLGWEKGIFSEHSKFTVGTPLNSILFNYNNQGLQYLRTGDVWEDASSSKETAFYNGDIDEKFIKKENDYLISLKGYNKNIGEGTLGLVTNYNNKKGIVCDNMYLVTPKEYDLVAYTAYVTKLSYIQNIILKTAVGSTARFATKMINKIEWIFPSKVEEMLLINSFFVSIDKEISSLKDLLEKEQLRFQWLLDNLLSGEYQVVDE